MLNTIYGAIIGDVVGSVFEFKKPRIKSKDFLFLSDESTFTDDTVMTIAVANTLLKVGVKNEEKFKQTLIEQMHYWGNKYLAVGYGARFEDWLKTYNKTPYNSYGNGSAMRVSPIGLFCKTVDEAEKVAKWSAEVTHNHVEGIKGAQSVVSVMMFLRKGYGKFYAKKYVEDVYGYNLDRKLEDIRSNYTFKVSCQESVPESILSFFYGNSYEDCIRNAVSLGGDTDTQAAIAGSMANIVYDIDEQLIEECKKRLPEDILEVCEKFQKKINKIKIKRIM